MCARTALDSFSPCCIIQWQWRRCLACFGKFSCNVYVCVYATRNASGGVAGLCGEAFRAPAAKTGIAKKGFFFFFFFFLAPFSWEHSALPRGRKPPENNAAPAGLRVSLSLSHSLSVYVRSFRRVVYIPFSSNCGAEKRHAPHSASAYRPLCVCVYVGPGQRGHK